jgi:hypothetical protein
LRSLGLAAGGVASTFGGTMAGYGACMVGMSRFIGGWWPEPGGSDGGSDDVDGGSMASMGWWRQPGGRLRLWLVQ